MNMISKLSLHFLTNADASDTMVLVVFFISRSLILVFMVSTHFLDLSTKVTSLAPLLRASRPRFPLPEKRSSTFAPSRYIEIVEKTASFTLSEVGLTPLEGIFILLDL